MDTPTHGLVGRLVARAVWPGHESRGLVNLATVSSLLPDLDVLWPGDALERLQSHRGVSHAFFGIAVGALAVAWIARRAGLKHVPFHKAYLVSLCGMLLHVLFDVVTSYGTVIFAPFSDYRASLDLLFIIDPYLDLILIAGLLLGWRFLRNRAVGYRLGVAALTAYMALNMAVTGGALYSLHRWAGQKGIPVEEIAAIPAPFSPLHRQGIILSQGQVYDIPTTWFQGIAGPIRAHPSALSDPRLSDIWQSREGRIYRWFARFPVVVEPLENEPGDLLLQDLRFAVRPDGLGWLGSLAAEAAVDHNPAFFRRRHFSLRVWLDPAQRVRRVAYTGSGADRQPAAHDRR